MSKIEKLSDSERRIEWITEWSGCLEEMLQNREEKATAKGDYAFKIWEYCKDSWEEITEFREDGKVVWSSSYWSCGFSVCWTALFLIKTICSRLL